MKFTPDMNSLQGLWRREFIRWPDGREDRTTRVWWAQADSYFVDLRISENRPDFSRISSLSDASPIHRDWFHSQQGFAGILRREGDAWLWQREFDLQPPTSLRDIGTLEFVDPNQNVMIERGIDAPYMEEWHRIATDPHSFALRPINNSQHGLLVVAGGHFLCATLRELLEISHGYSRGEMRDWIISDCSTPWRENQKLFPNPTDANCWQRIIEN